jgi:hypothetical protein
MVRDFLRNRYIVLLCIIALFALVYRLIILYPPYADGLPSGFDSYVHAGVAYSVVANGFAILPTDIYPPFYHLTLAFLYVVTGIPPIRLVLPYGIAVDVLSIFPVFYIAQRICDGNKSIGLLAAFFKSIDPISLNLLVMGSIPNLLGFFWLLLLISVLLSDLRNRWTGVLLMAVLSSLIFFTHLLVSAFLIFLFALIFIHEFILKRDSRYLKPLFFSLLIAAVPVGLYYIPRIAYFYLGVTTGEEYILWASSGFILVPIASLPAIFLVKRNWRNRNVSSKSPYLNFLEFWYAAPILIALVFIWQASIVSRMWQFLSVPAIIVISSVLVKKLTMMKKVRGPNPVKAITATLLVACVITTAVGGAYEFNAVFYATPARLELTNWISSHTPMSATFCTEEESLPTHLGWYITGLTGRTAYESLSNYAGAFEVGTEATNDILSAINITSLLVGSEYWTKAVRELNVTYVVLLAGEPHPNYAAISNEIVFQSESYIVYNVTTFTLS